MMRWLRHAGRDGCKLQLAIRYYSQLNNQLHLMKLLGRMNWHDRFQNSPLFLKIILSLQFAIFGCKWNYDDFALEWKKRYNMLWKCLLIHFLLKTTLSTTFSPFLYFLTIDFFFHGRGQGNLPSCPGPVKIVVNFLHRVCTMLQLICTFTLS